MNWTFKRRPFDGSRIRLRFLNGRTVVGKYLDGFVWASLTVRPRLEPWHRWEYVSTAE